MSSIGSIPICYSRPSSRPMHSILGDAHYSYGFAASKFVAALKSIGATVKELGRPEYYSSYCELGYRSPPIHLIFRSTEEIRLLKGAYNILCFAWEFDVLRDFHLPNELPFVNQVKMLSLV